MFQNNFFQACADQTPHIYWAFAIKKCSGTSVFKLDCLSYAGRLNSKLELWPAGYNRFTTSASSLEFLLFPHKSGHTFSFFTVNILEGMSSSRYHASLGPVGRCVGYWTGTKDLRDWCTVYEARTSTTANYATSVREVAGVKWHLQWPNKLSEDCRNISIRPQHLASCHEDTIPNAEVRHV